MFHHYRCTGCSADGGWKKNGGGPGREIRQVHIHDSDGNHIEVAFAPNEDADLTNYAGD